MSDLESNICYLFHVAFARDVWRKVQVPAESTLDFLHEAIITSYDFEDDHLYAFFMDKVLWSPLDVYWSPFANCLPSADLIKLQDFNFKKGDSFLYLFDFGDEWIFDVTFLKAVESENKNAVIVDSKGKAPYRYDDFYY